MSASSANERAGPALSVHKVVKRFGDIIAVDDVSFSVSGGSFLSLLGPSGSGKTTVMRLLAGFESPDEGTIEVDGADVSRLPPYRRDIGVVFQQYALFPHMAVTENVEFPLKQRGVSGGERRRRAQEVLEAVGLPGYGGRHPADLSGGEQQRVALARALVFKPRILVMDEPLAALDKRLRERMQQEIRDLQRRLRITTVYVTHDQTEAFAMSDLVAVMNQGRIEQVDEPRTIYERPRTEFVAGFVGDSNLFRGEVESTSAAEAAMRTPDGSLLRFPSSPTRSGTVTLLVRPEKMDIQVGRDVAGVPGNAIAGRLMDAMFMGETVTFRVSAGGEEVIVRKQNHAGITTAEPGADVVLSWPVTDTVVL